MRLVQRGIANNFGLVGKNIRRYLTTTALTATGLLAISAPALADGSWTDHQYSEGSATVTTPNVNTTNIQQHTSTVIAHGNASIYEGDTVNVNMNSSKDKYVVYDIKSDPTKIMGNLNSNGRIYIFDQNGVIFGENSQVNVGGIVTSTGHISNANLKADKDVFENVAGTGEIVNNGSITVAEGGLAAFVAPTVRNNGVINAKAGTVALASGNKVTLDLYGDGLVSIAAEGELSNAIIENKGTINANGGNVALTVAAAKDAVESVVNMDGIIDVSSSTGKGGNVKIDGGNKGAVKITGKIDASGQGGGDISIIGQNVLATSSASLDASANQNGNGGTIKIWGHGNAFFFGNAAARGGSVSGNGGFVEVSAADSVGYAGLVDTTAANGQTGRFLIDPQNVVLGTVDPAAMIANIGLDILLGGNLGTLIVDQQALANTLRTTDVDLWATNTISTAENIDISQYNYSTSTTTLKPFPAGCGAVCRGLWALNPGNYVTVVTNHSGITGNDLTLAAPTVNINHNITLGNGKLLVQDLEAGVSPIGLGLLPAPSDIIVNTLNLNGRIYKRATLADASFTTLADDSQIFTSADTINILSNNALIQQGVHFADETDEATINVAAGTYLESVLVDRAVNIKGANASKAGYDSTRGPETIIHPNSPGFKIVADNVTIDGLLIEGATGPDGYGVWVDVGADNATIKNSIIRNVAQNAVFSNTALSTTVENNDIDNTGSHGILFKGVSDGRILGNHIGTNGVDYSIVGDAIQIQNSHRTWVKYNHATNTKQTASNIGSGVHSITSDHVIIEENKTWDTDWDGVRVNQGTNVLVKKNDIDDARRTGVYLGQTKNSSAVENDIDLVGNYGVNLDRGSNVTADGNFIDDTGLDGIQAYNNIKSTIKGNKIGQTGVANNIKRNGIFVDAGSNSTVESNIISNTVVDGIRILATNRVLVSKNDIELTGDEGIHMEKAVGSLTITENYVDKTKKHGIRVTNSDKVKVLTNYVGLSGGVKNINGDGIRIEESDDVLAQYNQVTNTRSPHNNQGNGIQSIASNRTQIWDNILWQTAWDGVRVDGGEGVKVERNDIDNVVRSGVFAMNTSKTLIKDNFMDNLGHRGVYVYGGKEITIDNNNIDFALGSDPLLNDGIRADNIDGVVIKNNKIGMDGGPNTIGRHGIYAYNNEDVTILNNVVQNAVADGIHANKTKNHMLIELNDIDDVGGDGIEVNEFDTVLVNNNDVRDAVENGMLILKGSQATVSNNVGLGGTDNGISNVGKNGIKVGEVKDVVVNDNEVQLAGWDGIHVEYFNRALIKNNLVEQSGDDGIEAHNGVDVEIDNNTILNSGYGVIIPEEGGEDYDGYDEFDSGHDGIHVTNIVGSGDIRYDKVAALALPEATVGSIRITGNTIDVSGDDGVDVDNSEAYTYVYDNTISDSGVTDGGSTIIYNGVDKTGADGISIENVGQPYNYYSVVREGDVGNGEYNIVVAENVINDSQDDGVEIVGSYTPAVVKAAVSEVPYDYYYGGRTGRVLVQDNIITNSGWGTTGDGFADAQGYGADGIHVRNVNPGYYGDVQIGSSEGGFYGYAVDVLSNDVTNSGDDGVEVAYSESTLIDDNTIKNSGFASEGTEEPEGELFAKIDESDYGADGIHVRNVGYYFDGDEGDDEYSPREDEYYAKSLPGYGYQPYSVVIRRNDVDNSKDNGIQVHNDMWMPTAPVLVEINENVSFSGNQALYISGPTHKNVIVRGNAFSNFDTGGQFESGLIDLSQAGNSWTNGKIGLRFSPFDFGGEAPSWANLNLFDDDADGSTPYPNTPTNFGGTIGKQTFTGFTEAGKFYVYLDNGAFQNNGTPIWINGLESTYDTIQPGLTGGLLSEDDYNYLEARFRHFPDPGASSTDIFWFGFFPTEEDAALPVIEQSLIFNRFNAFNGDTTGLNVQIVSLPSLGGGSAVAPTAGALNQIGPFAGNNATDPSALNQIETAAGGEGQSNATQLNQIAPASGGASQSCWGNAVTSAANGQVVNVAYTGGAAANISLAAACGTGF